MTPFLIGYIAFSGALIFAYGLVLGIYIGKRLRSEAAESQERVDVRTAGPRKTA